jgi:hypothetical protein
LKTTAIINGDFVTVSEAGIAAGLTDLPLMITDAKTVEPNGITSRMSVHPN